MSFMSDRQVVELVEEFVLCFEVVFSNDWQMTKRCLSDDCIDGYVAPDGDFINPGVDDESNNWANRGCLLRAYRALCDALPEGHPFYRRGGSVTEHFRHLMERDEP